ncbi:MAG: hypothetical protein AB1742_03910, partial [bacterium]
AWLIALAENVAGSSEQFMDAVGGAAAPADEGLAASLSWCAENLEVVASLREILLEAWIRGAPCENFSNAGAAEWLFNAGAVLPFWSDYENAADEMHRLWIAASTKNLYEGDLAKKLPDGLTGEVMMKLEKIIYYSESTEETPEMNREYIETIARLVRKLILEMK